MAPTIKTTIANELRELIRLGDTFPDNTADPVGKLLDRFGPVGPGDTLPSLRELQTHYDCARDTVRDAISVLTHEGLVVPRRGIGTVIRDTALVVLCYDPAAPARTWAEQMGAGAQDKVVAVAWEDADPETARWLGVFPGAPVLHRTRHRLLADGIAGVHDQWIVAAVVADVAARTGIDLTDPTVTLPTDLFTLFSQAGHATTDTIEDVHARMPHPDERDLMDIPDGMPATVVDRITLEIIGGAERPVEGSRIVGAADRFVCSYRMPVPRKSTPDTPTG